MSFSIIVSKRIWLWSALTNRLVVAAPEIGVQGIFYLQRSQRLTLARHGIGKVLIPGRGQAQSRCGRVGVRHTQGAAERPVS